jgi:diguanylate cyclase (GGDEF)-like protein
VSFLMAALATTLVNARGDIDDLWSITVANALLAAGYGLAWCGVRVFNGRAAPPWAVLAGATAWLVACQFEAIYGSLRLRLTVMAVIVVTYSLLSAIDFWRARSESLMSRWPVIVLLATHAAIYATRIPLAGSFPDLTDDAVAPRWFALLVLETVLLAFCVAYLFGSLARERIVLWYKRASLTDPLTEVPNRRAFLVGADRLLRRARADAQPVALLALDIDHFKRVNDRFGHAAGDRVLIAFCRTAVAALRVSDLFGRTGGEEFTCLLPDTSRGDAIAVAERLRCEFAAVAFTGDGYSFTVTVSIGVVEVKHDLVSALAAADAALYRAKQNGRNRVEADAPPLPVQAPALAPT